MAYVSNLYTCQLFYINIIVFMTYIRRISLAKNRLYLVQVDCSMNCTHIGYPRVDDTIATPTRMLVVISKKKIGNMVWCNPVVLILCSMDILEYDLYSDIS